jgi:hypothetical protein
MPEQSLSQPAHHNMEPILASYTYLIARLSPFSPIFSKIGEVQPKVDFYTLKSLKLAPIALPRYLYLNFFDK